MSAILGNALILACLATYWVLDYRNTRRLAARQGRSMPRPFDLDARRTLRDQRPRPGGVGTVVVLLLAVNLAAEDRWPWSAIGILVAIGVLAPTVVRFTR